MVTPPASDSSARPRTMRAPEPARRRQRFPRSLRLTRKAEFERLLTTGRRMHDERLSLWVLPSGDGVTRLGLIVGARYGGSVQRNRAKRVLREAFRLIHAELPPGLELVCRPKVGAVMRLGECQESLRQLSRRAAGALCVNPKC